MINLKQLKVSIILGVCYTFGYFTFKIISILQGKTNDVYLLFFKDGLWFMPLILGVIVFFISSSCFYLLFRMLSFLINYFSKKGV